MVDKSGLISQPKFKELTKAEKEMLDMISNKFYTIKQITLVKKCSKQAVYKTIKKLKEKGALGYGLQAVDKSQSSSQPNQVRLHGQEFNIKIIWQDNRYQESLEKSNTLFLEGHTIRLYKNSIEVYAGEGISFYADEPERAEKKSFEYWQRLFAKLENNLKVIILKDGSHNIKIVNQHFERGGSEICENAIASGKIIKVYAEEDGKLAFTTDESFGGINDETLHPKTAKPDRKAVDKQVNDWRLNNPPTNSEIWKVSAENTLQLNQLIGTIGEYGKHIKSHTDAIKTLSKAMPELVKMLKNTKEENQKLKQRRLKEFGM